MKKVKKDLKKKLNIYKLVLLFFIVSQISIVLLKFPKVVDTAALTSASATLSNSRFSYRAGVATGTSGSSTVDIDGSGFSDNNTNHLFPNDVVCFADSAFQGCSQQKTYTINSIVDTDTMQLSANLTASLGANDLAIATQSGSLTLAFTTATEIPSGGDILITIPMADSLDGNDGFPDSAATAALGGFDLNGIAAADIATTGCTDGNWNTTETIAEGSGSTDHTVRVDRQTTSCAASSAITVTIDSAPGLINPAPKTGSHTQGVSDPYTINVRTRDGSDNTLDNVDVVVTPVEGVLVSATVDETMTFTVAGVASSQSTCGQTTSITTTATSIPWSTIAATNTFYYGSQQLTASTNADGGYAVKIEENDQMGKDGITCTGASAGEAENCVKDTVCDGACTQSSSAEWTTATNNGLGFSMANQTGTDASFLYNESSRTFSSRQIADIEGGETRQTLMANGSQVSGNSTYVCYKISISGTQPAGYYYNKIRYTAIPTF
ncbi:MAG: hypothetical protein ABH812_01470 [bacterium]